MNEDAHAGPRALADAARRAARVLAASGEETLARGAGCLLGEAAPASAVALVEAEQGADGSFGDADLSAARRRVAFLSDLGVREGAALEKVCAWLRSVQRPDGAFGAGDEDAVFETGVLAGLLARTPCAPTRMLDAAGDWLSARFTPDAVKGLRWRPLAAHAAAFSNLIHDEADGILQWCGRELERGFRSGHYDALQVGRVLLWCDAPSLPGGKVSADELLPLLLAQQSGDGSFRPDAPPAQRLQATWDGLVALVRFGGPSPVAAGGASG